MYPAQFDYHRASSVAQALDLLASKQDAKLLAGGHSLLPMMKLRLAQPANLIDIGGIKELSGIARAGDAVRIGALTTHAEIAASDVLKRSCPIVAEAAAKIGDQQVRNRGTIGGNLSHADPGSDLPAVMKALDATLHLVSKRGKRTAKAADFFTDLLTTDIRDGEILEAIEVPALGPSTGCCYLKFEHPASGYAVVGTAALVRLGRDGKCESARLCFNGVTATPLDAGAVTGALAGQKLDDAVIDQAVGRLEAPDPLGDVFASGEYRVHLAKVFGRRALKLARDRAS